MASVNTWKQTELVAISGLQIHFVPKKEEMKVSRRRTLWIRYSERFGLEREVVIGLAHCDVWPCMSPQEWFFEGVCCGRSL